MDKERNWSQYPTKKPYTSNVDGVDLDKPFSFRIHHIVGEKRMEYIGGVVYTMNDCTLDEWSLQEFVSVLKSLGYKGNAMIFVHLPFQSLETGLIEVKNDDGAAYAAKVAVGLHSRQADIYILHGCNPGEGVQLTIEDSMTAIPVGSNGDGNKNGSNHGQGNVNEQVIAEEHNEQDNGGEDDENESDSDDSVKDVHFVDSNNGEDDCFAEFCDDLPDNLDAIARELSQNPTLQQPEVVTEQEYIVVDQAEEEAIVEQPEVVAVEKAMSTQSEGLTKDSGCSVHLGRKRHVKNRKTKAGKGVTNKAKRDAQDMATERNEFDDEQLASDLDPDELYSPDEAEDDGGVRRAKVRYPRYNPSMMSKDFKFELGMEFASLKLFKDAVIEWALLHGWGVNFKKNDKERCRVICRDGCEWLCLCSKVKGELTFRVKTLNDKHTCGRTYKGKLAKGKRVGQKIIQEMSKNKHMSLSTVIEEIRGKYCAEISVFKAYVGRKAAKEVITGSFKKQCTQLFDFCNELRRTNPGSTTIIKTEESLTGAHERIFQRIYICLKPVVDGFLAACRPLIGLDGCFLKGEYHGILLVAVGRDPNDQYFPLAFAVVESENKDSWEWFVGLLLEDIGKEKPWVMISDQQKGLVPVLESMPEIIEQRTCVRHLYANLKKNHGGGTAIRDLMWAAANATYHAEWERHMQQMKAMKQEAYDYLMRHSAKLWTKAEFTAWSKSDLLTNNISEAFNSRLLEARELPIISLINWIREYMMTRFAKNRILCERYKGKGKICPRPRKRLDKLMIQAGMWRAKWSGQDEYEVKSVIRSEQFIVSLERRMCSCRLWDLSGIPCVHAVAAIKERNLDPYDFIDECFSIEKYEQCYGSVIMPINGENMWSKVQGQPTIVPPNTRTPVGRPKKQRRREPNEPPGRSKYKLTRSNKKVTCSKCGSFGHNKRTCTGPTTSASNPAATRIDPVDSGSSPAILLLPVDGLAPQMASPPPSSQIRASQSSTSVEGPSSQRSAYSSVDELVWRNIGGNYTTNVGREKMHIRRA